MTAPREVLPGRTYSIVRRCTQRQFLLRPDDETFAIFAYCLAEAAMRCEVRLLAWTAMSNHYHSVVYDEHGRLPEFLEHFHKMTARALNSYHGRSENLWSSEETTVTYLPSREDIDNKVVYVLANPIAAHLVECVADWPGASSWHHLDGRMTEHLRPKRYFSSKGTMPEAVHLAVSLPPIIAAFETLEQWATRIRAIVRQREDDLKAARLKSGDRVVGRQAVLRTSPFERPTSDEVRRTISSAVAGVARKTRQAATAALAAFRAAYRIARCAFTAGQRETKFPPGTYRFRLLGACCEPYPAVDLAAAA